jgi:hypothetical protein
MMAFHPVAYLFVLLISTCIVQAWIPSSRINVVTTRSSPRHSAIVVQSSTTAKNNNSNLPDGVTKRVIQAGTGPPVRWGDIVTVQYTGSLLDDPDGIPFARSSATKCAVGDASLLPGWDAGLRSMQVGERSVLRLEPQQAYGATGVPPVIPPHAVLEWDVTVLDAQEATANIDFDSLALADPTPRTAADIAQAFAIKQAALSKIPKKEGWEGFLDRASKFYFFGLFEGETGERAPWFLRPSITFPLAFAIVGLAFYVSYAGGAISERGAPKADELDELILSQASTVASSWLLASNALLSATIQQLTL